MKLKAIDISHWEGDYAHGNPPSWANAVVEGILFGVMKATQGRAVDPMFEYNWWAMERYGVLKTGYHFFQATDGIKEARLFAKCLTGRDASDLPPVLDFEPPMTVKIPNVAARVKAWIDIVEAELLTPVMIYTGAPYWNFQFPTPPAWIAGRKLWLAAYPTDVSTSKDQWDLTGYSYQTPKLPIGWTLPQLLMWQFSDRGSVPGFSGGVDLNYYYPEGFPG